MTTTGRPRKPSGQARDTRITITVTAEEAEELAQAARECERTASSFIRLCALAAARSEKGGSGQV